MPVRCTEDQDLVGEKDERGKALSANAHSRISHLSTSTGTYERVNVNWLSLSSPDFHGGGPLPPPNLQSTAHMFHIMLIT